MPKKKILIDSISLLSSFTGIGRYTYENSLQLKELDSTNIEWYFNYGPHSKELYCDDSMQEEFKFLKRLKSLLTKLPLVKKVARKILPIVSRLNSRIYDLYWQPNFIPESNIKAKHIVSTVHDFSFYLQPQWHPKERLDYFENNFWKNVKKSDHIITGSHFSKEEIIKYLKFDASKITVIHHGVDHDIYKVYPKEILQETKKKFDLPTNFILFVGSIEPRKNLITLLKAYTNLSNKDKDNTSLVLVGFKGWENKEIMQLIEKEKSHIKYLGYVEDQELPLIYNLASVFVYPTYYEGFGIPPIEAFACGTPVIVSSAASLPEVCGNAALYINPNNEDDLKRKLEILLNDSTLQKALIKKGLEKVKEYSWQKSAQKHLEVFTEVLNNDA